MTQAQSVVAAAVSQLGYKEGANNDNIYGRWYGMNNQPWCMIFVSWCAERAGVSTQIIPKLAYVPYAVEHFRQRGLYRAAGSGYIPKPGDLIFFGSSSHVGIVESCNGVTVSSIEGNTGAGGNSSNGDGVYRRQRALSHSWIMGYALPDYAESTQPQPGTVRIRREDSGETLQLSGFVIGGRTYVMLRDMEKLAELKIDWDEKERVATVGPKA